MKTLLLQPHLTLCCGNHISEEAASRIQREGGACPLCNAPQWSTVLSKHFQRQVNALRLFCYHKDRGCEWQGELSDMERHIQSCPRKDARLAIGSGQAWSQMWASMAPTWMWREGKKAPEQMRRGAAVVHGNTAYFRPANSTKVYSYQNIAGEKQWSQLPDNPNVNCGLMVFSLVWVVITMAPQMFSSVSQEKVRGSSGWRSFPLCPHHDMVQLVSILKMV